MLREVDIALSTPWSPLKLYLYRSPPLFPVMQNGMVRFRSYSVLRRPVIIICLVKGQESGAA